MSEVMENFKLKDLINIKNGTKYSHLHVGDIPLYGSGGIMSYVDDFLFEGEAILLPRKGTLSNIMYTNGKIWTIDTMYYATVNSNAVPYYLYSYLSILDLQHLDSGSALPSMTKSVYEDLVVNLPTLSNQKKIAAILFSLDSKIELNNRINSELEAMAKTLYDYWFVQFDFPDQDGKPYKSSGGKMVYNETLKREIPEGWEAGIASDLFVFNPTLSLSKNIISSYIDMSALPTFGFMTSRVKKKEYNGGMKFQNGDVAVARITPCLENGKTGMITLLDDNEIGFGSTEFIILRGKNQPLSCFAACLSRSESFRKFAISNMTGTSGRKRIEANILQTFSMPIPNEDLLLKFEKTLNSFFKKLTTHTKENEQLSQLRDWLLPMLMNGQVTVK